jgi:hypothetical protein
MMAADAIDGWPGDVVIVAEPAPYSMPPVDLFKRRLLLIEPNDWPPPHGWYIRASDTSDRFFDTPISWANKMMRPTVY